MICVLCNEEFEEIENVKWGNLEFQCVGGHNPAPLAKEGRCCSKCNYNKVTIARAMLMFNNKKEKDGSN